MSIYCAAQTRQNNEPLYGTASTAQIWFLLEYRQPWRAKAVTDNDLPQAVQDYWAQLLTAVPGSRLLFIKQDNSVAETLRLFVVRSGEEDAQIFELPFHSYEELPAFDLQDLTSGAQGYHAYDRERPLLLVCTNGKRDKCCSRFGLPLYKALSDSDRLDVWQCSHIGGHRYAPTLLLLPHSVNYGLLTVEEAIPAMEAALKGEIFNLNRYRGRTFYPPIVQAADYFLRRKLNLLSLSGVSLLAFQAESDGSSQVIFQLASGQIHSVQVQEHLTPEPLLVSCNSPKSKPVPRFKLLGFDA